MNRSLRLLPRIALAVLVLALLAACGNKGDLVHPDTPQDSPSH